jgi:hypothetical protein
VRILGALGSAVQAGFAYLDSIQVRCFAHGSYMWHTWIMQTASYESAQASSAKTAAAPRGAFSQPPLEPSVNTERREPRVLPQGVFEQRDRA